MWGRRISAITRAWGYGGIVLPNARFHTSFAIADPQNFRDEIAAFYFAVRKVYDTNGVALTEHDYIAAVIASMVEHVLWFDLDLMADDRAMQAAVFASALAQRAGRFWLVTAMQDDVGTSSAIERLTVTTPEAARDIIAEKCAPLSYVM